MTTLATPSPTLSPKPSFHGASSHSSFKRPSLSTSSAKPHTSSSSSSGHTSGRRSNGPFQSMEQPAVKAASPLLKQPTVDAGTQYTPPGYPPTSRWPAPSTNIDNITRSTNAITFAAPMQTTPHSTTTPSKRREPEPEHEHNVSTDTDTLSQPPEPNPRVDPSPHLSLVSSTSTIANTSRNSSDSSPSKRAKSSGTKKVLPANYAECSVTDLGILISDMLMELVRINDKIPLRDGQLTRFHSRYVFIIIWNLDRAVMAASIDCP